MISSISPVSVSANGQLIYLTLAYKQAIGSTPNAFWLLVEPPGVTFVSASNGVYAPYAGPPPGTTARVDMGPVSVGQTMTTILTYSVTNIANGPFIFSGGINGNDTILTNNGFVFNVLATFTPPTGLTLNSEGCVCGSVSDIDIPCSSCTSEWRVVAGSETNVVFHYYDPATGDYRVGYVDITQDITWQKELWCINCADGNDYLVSGPSTHTIPAFSTTPINPIWEQEDFDLLPGVTSFIISTAPVPGYDVHVEVGGATLKEIDFNIVGTTVNLVTPVSLAIGAAGPTVGAVIHYFRP